MCPYVQYRPQRLHRRANVAVDGVQVATGLNKDDDTVDFFFAFENMSYEDNTINAGLYKVEGWRDVRNAMRCETPGGVTPSYIVDLAPVTTTDKSDNVAFTSAIDGTVFSLF